VGRRIRRVWVDGFFFFKTVPYPSHICARRGYTGTMGTDTGYSGTGRRVWDFFLLFFSFVVFVLQIYFLFYNVVKSE
jgi:hypothetical protein